MLPQINLYNEIKPIISPNLPESITIENKKAKSTAKNLIDELKLLTNHLKAAIYELALVVLLGIPIIILFVYVIIVLYKCLCSNKYEMWRRTWSTSNIKKQYDKIHVYNDNDNSENDNNYGSQHHVTSSSSIRSMSDDLDIMNLHVHPLAQLSSHHKYPIDIVEGNKSNRFVTIDLNNCINIWNTKFNNYNLANMDFNSLVGCDRTVIDNRSLSIWSACLLGDDLLLVGLSNGHLYLVNCMTTQLTHLTTSSSTAAAKSHCQLPIVKLVNFKTDKTNTQFCVYSILTVRLNGFFQIDKLFIQTTDNFYLKYECKQSVRAHEYTIRYFAHNENRIVTMTNDDHTMKLFDLDSLDMISRPIVVTDTCNILQIDDIDQIYLCAISGIIQVYQMNKFIYKLRTNKSTKPMCSLAVNQTCLFALNQINYFFVWNKSTGTLVKFINLSQQYSVSTMDNNSCFGNATIVPCGDKGLVVVVFNLVFYLIDIQRFKLKKIFTIYLNQNSSSSKNVKILSLFDTNWCQDVKSCGHVTAEKFFLISNFTNILYLYELSDVICS
jgi:hypothetical protein